MRNRTVDAERFLRVARQRLSEFGVASRWTRTRRLPAAVSTRSSTCPGSHGQELLTQEGLDDAAAAVRILGNDIVTIVGAERLAEIAARWPGSPKHLLVHYMSVPNAPDWPNSNDRRLELVLAMERGLRLS